MLILPDELFLLCLPSFDSYKRFSDFLALRLVSTRFNSILKSNKLWESLSKSQIESLCKLLSSHWSGMRDLKLENPLEEINKLPFYVKYNIPTEIKKWLIGDARITLTKLIEVMLMSARKRFRVRYTLLKESLLREEEVSKEIKICKNKLDGVNDLIDKIV